MKKLFAFAVLAIGILTLAPISAEAGHYCSPSPRPYAQYYGYDYGYYQPYYPRHHHGYGYRYWTRPIVHTHYHGCGHYGRRYVY
ncbi:MAG: hypothetical protein Q8Q33_08765 [Chlamydiota bacterium]|nr:hypothetical protein [Chlamydiota bacterium]